MSWDKVKNWVFGGGGAVAFVLMMGFIDWRVGVKVTEALSAMDIGTDSNIIAMDTIAAANTSGVAENKEDNEFTAQQLRDVARVLMKPPSE